MRAPLQAVVVAFVGLAAVACAQRDPSQGGAPSPASSPHVTVASSASESGETAAAPSASTPPPPEPDPNAPLRVIDMHVDTPYQIVQKGKPIELTEGQATLSALSAGRYAGIVYPIYIADYLNKDHPRIADADRILATIDEMVGRHELLVFERDGGGGASGVTAYLAIEGAGAFAEDITQIDRFIARGIRFVGPVHAKDDALASSATGASGGSFGLTELGKTFCRRVYEKGALVDVSHMSDRAFADLVPIAAELGAPIVATHSNARKLADHPRNLTDAQLRKIAETGGVAGLNLHSQFLNISGTATMDDAVNHVLYMVKIAGVDHVGIGSDFDGGRPPSDFGDASKFPEFAERLMERGMSRADVRKVFSGNVERVLRFSPSSGKGSVP